MIVALPNLGRDRGSPALGAGLFGGKVISPASLAKMTTPFKSDYALGVVLRTANGRKMVQHGGGIDGFNTFLACK